MALALAASAAAVPLQQQPQQPLNLDFERAAVNGSGGAWGWSLGWSAFQGGSVATFLRDSTGAHGGRYSLRISVPDSATDGRAAGHPAAGAVGLRAGPPPGAFGMDSPVPQPLRDRPAPRSRSRRGRTATSPRPTPRGPGPEACRPGQWTRVLLDISVPDDATIHSIVIGALLDGTGSAWFDDLSLSVDGRRITTLPVDPPPPSGKDLAWLASRSAPLFPDSGLAAFDAPRGQRHHRRPGRIDAWHARVLRDEGAPRRAPCADAGRAGLRHRGEPARGRTHQPLSCRVGRAARAMRWGCCSGCGTRRRCWRWSSGSGRGTSIMPVRWCASPGSTCRTTGRPADTLRAFLAASRAVARGPFDSLSVEYLAQPRSTTPSIPDSVRARMAAAGRAAAGGGEHARVDNGFRAPHRAQDSASVEWAVQAANLYRQAARLNASLNSPERDSLMAATSPGS